MHLHSTPFNMAEVIIVHSLHSHLHRIAEGAIASDDRTALAEDDLMQSLAIPQPGVSPAAIT